MASRLDWLARSTRDLLDILDTLARRGAAFRSLGDTWADTTTAHGHLMSTVLGGLAAFERELIRLRTGEARTRAKARGVHMGVHMGRPRYSLPCSAAKLCGRSRRASRRRPTWCAGSTSAKAPSPAWRVRPRLQRRRLIPKPNMRRVCSCAASRPPTLRLKGLFLAAARGAHKPDSDADLAVILKGEHGDRYKVSREIAGIAIDVMFETGVLINPLPLRENELKRPETFSNPALIENINNQALRDRLYEQGIHRFSHYASYAYFLIAARSDAAPRAPGGAGDTEKCLARTFHAGDSGAPKPSPVQLVRSLHSRLPA